MGAMGTMPFLLVEVENEAARLSKRGCHVTGRRLDFFLFAIEVYKHWHRNHTTDSMMMEEAKHRTFYGNSVHSLSSVLD